MQGADDVQGTAMDAVTSTVIMGETFRGASMFRSVPALIGHSDTIVLGTLVGARQYEPPSSEFSPQNQTAIEAAPVKPSYR